MRRGGGRKKEERRKSKAGVGRGEQNAGEPWREIFLHGSNSLFKIIVCVHIMHVWRMPLAQCMCVEVREQLCGAVLPSTSMWVLRARSLGLRSNPPHQPLGLFLSKESQTPWWSKQARNSWVLSSARWMLLIIWTLWPCHQRKMHTCTCILLSPEHLRPIWRSRTWVRSTAYFLTPLCSTRPPSVGSACSLVSLEENTVCCQDPWTWQGR